MTATTPKASPLPPVIQQLEGRARDVREYAGGDASKAWIELFDALEASYKEDLVTCEPEAMRAKQALVKQMRRLKTLAAAGNINGRV